MKTGRINERNIGNWTLEGEPKQRGKRPVQFPDLTPEQASAFDVVKMIDGLIQSHQGNYVSYLGYDLSNKLISHWVENGIVAKGVKESKYPDLFPSKEICLLSPDRINDLKLTRGLLVHFHNLTGLI